MGGKVKNENVKVEKKDGSHYYIANMDLKKLDFINDNVICFIGDIRNHPAVFEIKYHERGYANSIYVVSNNCNDENNILNSLVKVKEFIANNIVC